MNNVLLFSDMHCSVSAYQLLQDLLHQKFSGIIFAGDFVNQGEPLSYIKKTAELIIDSQIPFYWVPGNNDFGKSYDYLQMKIPSIEGRVAKIGKYKITGVGGSPESWSSQYAGEKSISSNDVAGSIFVSHVPLPVLVNLEKHDKEISESKIEKRNKQEIIKEINSKFDSHSEASAEESSERRERAATPRSFACTQDDKPRNRFKDSPLVHISGHIHNSWGVGYLGQTKVVKLASFFFGHYAIMDLDTLKVEFKKANFNPYTF